MFGPVMIKNSLSPSNVNKNKKLKQTKTITKTKNKQKVLKCCLKIMARNDAEKKKKRPFFGSIALFSYLVPVQYHLR